MTPDPVLGRQLANFKIERVIGRGGMATVYFGHDVKLHRPVAIKVIDARYRDQPVYVERFLRESRVVATWRHEHIVQIYYAGDEDGLYYFVMEYIDGGDLGVYLAQHVTDRAHVPLAEVLRIGYAVAQALDYAHVRGVIHRDVKPANVLLARDGRVVLTDFGLALDVQQGSLGEVFGSSLYIAPEQARRSADAVPQSDLYALGVILYQMLTDALPFNDPSPTSVALQHMTLAPPPPRQLNPALNVETEAVLLKALSKSPAERYPTGLALMTALEAALGVSASILAQTQLSKATQLARGDESLIGWQLDEYRLDAVLGHGGMARIYRGLDVQLNRYAAIKVIDTPFRADADYSARFKREARAIAQLDHPNIVRLYRYGEAAGLLYMAMQYMDGADLQVVLAEQRQHGGQLPPDRINSILREVGAALDYAHAKGVIHRDVKPSNIIITQDGHAVLTDFGLALLRDTGSRGEIFGSPYYIAPEQAMSSASVTPQSDLYALGVIAYELVTGRVPFDADSPLDIAMLHMTEPPPSPSAIKPDVCPVLEAAILKALSKEPADRYASGADLATAIDRALKAAPDQSAAVPPKIEAAPIQYELPPLPAAVIDVVPESPVVETAQPAKRRRRVSCLLVGAGLLCAIGLIGLTIFNQGGFSALTLLSATATSASPVPSPTIERPIALISPLMTPSATATIQPTSTATVTQTVTPTPSVTSTQPASTATPTLTSTLVTPTLSPPVVVVKATPPFKTWLPLVLRQARFR